MSKFSRLFFLTPGAPVKAVVVFGGIPMEVKCTARALSRNYRRNGCKVLHWQALDRPDAEAMNPLPQGFLSDKDSRRTAWYKKRGWRRDGYRE